MLYAARTNVVASVDMQFVQNEVQSLESVRSKANAKPITDAERDCCVNNTDVWSRILTVNRSKKYLLYGRNGFRLNTHCRKSHGQREQMQIKLILTRQ